MKGITVSLLCFCALFSILMTSHAVDTIAPSQAIRDGNTIISASENFELGFFSPGNSSYRYVGIWYKKVPARTVVWVANKETPLTGTSGVFKFSSEAILLLLDGNDHVVWSLNASGSVRVTNPVAQLLDTGNLVVREESDSMGKNFIWQSFDNPSDTLLPGMKFGKDLICGKQMHTTSWKSSNDPSPGNYTVWMDVNGYPQLLVKKGSLIHYRLGPWNGIGFSGMPAYKYNPIFNQEFVFNRKEIYYKYELVDSTSAVTRMVVTSEGSIQISNWFKGTQDWSLYLDANAGTCFGYGMCGAYGGCSIDKSDSCGCLKGFEPKRTEEWSAGDWSSGCQRRIGLDCGEGVGFRKFSGVKLPDTRYCSFSGTMDLVECEMACRNNCSCTAYANLEVNKVGCLLWFGDLIDIGVSPINQDLYVKLSAFELLDYGSRSNTIKFVLLPLAGVVVLAVALAFCIWRTMKKSHLRRQDKPSLALAYTTLSQKEDLELPLFSFSRIVMATDNFSIKNKLGEGGFGPVYKGLLEDGREVAVKQLSQTSTQGLEEFKNEVVCIAKLQHRNLVKLLGYCIQEDELMLIYEYMPNKSLDSLIFDETNSLLLNWPQRFHIVQGVARGLLYLHQDSRLRIIHRDLKASNILLDIDMNPKISDFGLARMFEGHETENKTKKVVGTFGYISPEYAVKGHFSVKSDVFSYGVLVLEIVCGKKNREFCHQDSSDSLLGHAWRLFKEGKSLELIDARLRTSYAISEVLRSIHVGLLCVQHRAEDRPNMSSVVLMLGSDGPLPPPKRPGFFTEWNMPKLKSVSAAEARISVDEVTITLTNPR